MYVRLRKSLKFLFSLFYFRLDKKLYVAQPVKSWMVVVYEAQERFKRSTVDDMVKAFCEGAKSVGKLY